MVLRVLQITALLLFSTTAIAQGIRAQLGDESARFMYVTEAWGQQYGRLELEGGLMFTEKDDYLVNLGLQVRNENVDAPLVIAVGGRAYYISIDVPAKDVFAIALGGDILFLPEALNGIGFGAYFWGAPTVVSFADSEGLIEYGVTLNYQITPQANIFVGYQKIEVEIENVSPDVEIDKGAFFGINLQF